jgi:hypothetical protein
MTAYFALVTSQQAFVKNRPELKFPFSGVTPSSTAEKEKTLKERRGRTWIATRS